MRTKLLALAGSIVLCACGPDGRDDMTGDGDGDGDGDGSGSGSGSGSGGGGQVYVYAHSASALYRVDPDTLAITKVGDFGWGSVGSDQMTDIAIDRTGLMIGISFGRVFRVDTNTAQTALLSGSLDGTFNGLSFVPATQIGATGDDVLVGTRNSDGKVFRIDPMTGAATQIGDMGAYTSSGDLVAVDGFGTMQTISGGFFGGTDSLARLAQTSFAASPVGSTGYGQIWGVAFWKDKIYGFTNGGQFVLIDPVTGAGTMVSQTPGVAWWGAAVNTLAPVLQ
jgi:hypothetical protein